MSEIAKLSELVTRYADLIGHHMPALTTYYGQSQATVDRDRLADFGPPLVALADAVLRLTQARASAPPSDAGSAPPPTV